MRFLGIHNFYYYICPLFSLYFIANETNNSYRQAIDEYFFYAIY